MIEYKFNELAYGKMIFHAAKYPHLAVNGILLGKECHQDDKNVVNIVDAIPLFHQCLSLTSMSELALMQIETYAEDQDLLIVGYYAASENFYDNTPDGAPAAKVADKIQEQFRKACFVIIDNKLMMTEQERTALKVFLSNGDGKWSKTAFTLINGAHSLNTVSELLKRGVMKEIMDFDNHLDNPENDWTNRFLNDGLGQILSMKNNWK